MGLYKKKLLNPKWQRKRLEILDRDDFTCTVCGDTETELQIHHKKYTGEPWQANSDDLTTLCSHCHTVISVTKADNINVLYVVNGRIYRAELYGRYIMYLLYKSDTQKHLSIINFSL